MIETKYDQFFFKVIITFCNCGYSLSLGSKRNINALKNYVHVLFIELWAFGSWGKHSSNKHR